MKLGKSSPEQKLLPSPWRTTARTERSRSDLVDRARRSPRTSRSRGRCACPGGSGGPRRRGRAISTATRSLGLADGSMASAQPICGRVALDDRRRDRRRPAACRRRGPSRRRGGWRRRRRRPPGRRSGPAASPAARAPSARPGGGRATRSRSRSPSSAREPAAEAVEPRLALRRPRRPRRQKASSRLGALDHRPQDVEALDVAGALPDRVQRRLAEQPRHPRLLDVAVAAEALERLDRVRGGALADPVLEHRRGEPADQRRATRRRRAPRRTGGPATAPRPSPPPTRSRGRRARCCISGCSTSILPKAERCSACQIAWATPARMPRRRRRSRSRGGCG